MHILELQKQGRNFPAYDRNNDELGKVGRLYHFSRDLKKKNYCKHHVL